MTNHIIDNTIKNLGKVVLWQYDKAYRLLALIKHMHVLYVCAVEQFWKFWDKSVLSIDSSNMFGLTVFGKLVGVQAPTIIDETGEKRFVVPSVYKKLIKGQFELQSSNGSFEGILNYVDIVFGIDGQNNLTKWLGYVSEYGWSTNVDDLNFRYQPKRFYERGYVFWYDEEGDGSDTNWKCDRYITPEENISFDAIKPYLTKTIDKPTGSGQENTLFLNLIDPEGYVRKVAAGPKDALKLELSYTFGEYTIIARATRMQKCGVSVVDNGDMSIDYVKTSYYDEMHKDQKFLFEQKRDDVCPYPLGVKTNEPAELWRFGFDGQQPQDMYEIGRSYSKCDVIGYIDGDYHGFHWEFKRDVSASENTSFDAIKEYLVKTREGDPFISGIADTDAFDCPQLTTMYLTKNDKTPIPFYYDNVAKKTSIMMSINNYSLFKAEVDDVPNEFLVNGFNGNGTIMADGLVLPIQKEEWDLELSNSIEPMNSRGETVINIVSATTQTIPINRTSFNAGRINDDRYYRTGTLINTGNEYRFVKEGGKVVNGRFSGVDVMPDRSTLIGIDELKKVKKTIILN